MNLPRIALAMVLSFGGLAALRADPVTYSYTSANFDLINATYDLDPNFTYTTAHKLTFSFTLGSALASGVTTDLAMQSMSWSASDGKYTYGSSGQVGLLYPDNLNPGESASVLNAVVTTDLSGNIVGWNFALFGGAHASQFYSNSTPFPVGMALYWATVYEYGYSRPGDSGDGGLPIEFAGTTRKGSWTTTGGSPSVPDSAGTALLLTIGCGFLSLVRVRRR